MRSRLQQVACAAAMAWVGMGGVLAQGLAAAGAAPVSAPQAAIAAPALDLHTALARALARDPQVASARALLEAARAQSRQARSRLWPSAGVTATYGRGTDADPPSVFDRTTNRSEAFLRWNLFNGLADQTLIDAQQMEEAAAAAELLRVLDEACERLGQAYYALLRQQHKLTQAERYLEEVELTVRRVQRQAELGKGSDADAQLAASSLIDARLALQTAQADHAVAQMQLQVLLGEAGEGVAASRVVEEAPPPAEAEQPLEDWRARAERGNGELLAATSRAGAARIRVGRIAPEYLPRVDLNLRRQLHERTVPATNTTRRGWTLALTYEVPLGGAPAARRDESRARAEAAEAELRRVRDAIQAELGQQRQQVLTAREAAPQLARQREHLDAVLRAGVLQYDAGRRSLQQLIEQQERRFATQQRDADNAWRLATGQLRLRMLAGELAAWLGVEP